MPPTLPEFLRKQAERSLAYLQREAAAVSVEDAFRGRRNNWPDQKWGIGQDGSIAGIVYHVAAWKQLTLPVFAPDGTPLSRADFDPSTAPDQNDWPALLAWLSQIGADWNSALAAVPDAELDAIRGWEGASLPLARIVTEMVQHDIQHAAQIEYLRQLYASML